MKKEIFKKKIYDSLIIEVIEFLMKDLIVISGGI